MKRILWCVLTLLAWGTIAYFCYRMFGSELAGYIVGVVGAAGTFAAMFLTPAPSPSIPGETIATLGDYSPGKVGGSYSVGRTGPAEPAPAPASPEPAPQDQVSISTQGDFSPGSVGGNYEIESDNPRSNKPQANISVRPAMQHGDPAKASIATGGNYSPGWVGGNYQITQMIVQQYEKARRKTWRELSEAPFPLLRDSDTSHQQLWNTLSQSAALCFRNAGFTRFTFILHRREQVVEGERMPIYTMLTNQPEFCATAHDNYSELMHELVEWKQAGASPDARAAIEKRWYDKLQIVEGWSKGARISTRNGWNAVQCTCDSATKFCEFESLERLSVDPADYHQHVETTSEMLLYVVSALNANIALMGDVGWYSENYPLMKLSIHILDHKSIEMGAIRFNVHDPEEWDYMNGAFDAEIRKFKSSNPTN